MKNLWSILLCGGTLGLLFFTSCPTTVLPEVDARSVYTVGMGAIEHGYLGVSQRQAHENEWIIVYPYPDPGYVLQLNQNDEATLEYRYSFIDTTSGSRVVQTSKIRKVSSYQFQMPADDVIISGQFEIAPAGIYSVSIDPNISNCEILTDPVGYRAGTEVNFTIIPAAGYGLVSGSLKVIRNDNSSDVIVLGDEPPYKFTITGHVTVTAQLEEKNADGLKQSGRNALSAGEYDTAAVFYEAAYQKNPSDPESIIYSSLGKLGTLLLNRDVRDILSSLDFAVIPSSLKDWICDKDWTGKEDDRWYETYAGIYYDDAGEPYPYYDEDADLPKLGTNIPGFPGGFLNFKLVHKYGYIKPPSRIVWPNLLFWALISNNRDGFNNRLDNILKYVFGDTFEEAAARVAKLSYNDPPVLLNDRLKERFDLEEFYGTEPTYIGKAEMDMIFSYLRGIKAAFEYLATYDWEIQLRTWLLDEIEADWGLDKILENMFRMGDVRDDRKDYWRDSITISRILPLKNNFLKTRNSSSMVKARDDLTAAVHTAKTAVDYYFGTQNYLSTTAKANLNAKYRWAKGGVDQAYEALNKNGVFYFPQKLPKTDAEKLMATAWPDEHDSIYLGNPKNQVYGVAFGEFFIPGQFTLTNLFTTTAAGTIPVLYRLRWHEDANHTILFDEGGVPISAENTVYRRTAAESTIGFDTPRSEANANPPVVRPADWDLGPYGIFSFEVNTAHLKRIFPKGFEQHGDRAFLHDVFDEIPIWPWAPTYMVEQSPAAKQLYHYYNLR